MSRSHGFLEEAVKEIWARPGQSAQEIAESLLADGRATSTAESPMGSLVATLHKHHAGKPVRREWQGGQYRYFPESDSQSDEMTELRLPNGSDPSEELTTGLPKDCAEFIDALAVLPQFSGRRDVVLWLLRKGMESVRVS